MNVELDLDPALHAPARLQIAAMLARANEAEFAVIRDVVNVSDSVLSKHLSALDDAGYIAIEKVPRDGRQRTWASLTKEGRRAFDRHMRAVTALVEAAQSAIAAE